MKKLMTEWRNYLQEGPFGSPKPAEADPTAGGRAAIAGAVGKAGQEAAGEAEEDPNIELQTVGDLRALVTRASRAKRAGNVKDAALGFLKGLPLSFLGPGAVLVDLAKSAYSLPDTKKLQPGLNKLNVDDEVSAIVDDNLENAFLKTLDKELKTLPDDTPLAKLDMTQLLAKFIHGKHEKRTVTVPEEGS